jgi:hypothetical protein
MGVGTSNATGVFNNLMAGDYSIRLTDSCGGIQTRQITVNNYAWSIDAYAFTEPSCDQATGYIRVVDSRGNISTSGGIPGFMYGVALAPGDTIWSSSPNLSFSLNGHSSFTVLAKDPCGNIKTANAAVSFVPFVQASVNTYGFTCDRFNASITNIRNFFNPDFCLYDNSDNLITCNTTGVFTGLPYGSYCIKVHDACTDTTITRCFTGTPPPISVAAQVIISQKTCTTFTASIGATTGLTSPLFCLYDSAGTQLACNSNGVFTGLTYGPYCIEVRDGCRDTSFTRCFSPNRPIPVFHPLTPAYTVCSGFGIHANADSLSNPLFCLLDSLGNVITCNNTGVFDSIPYGNYCVSMYDSCYDVTLTQCIDVAGPEVLNDFNIRSSYDRCNSFTITASTQNSVGQYCLYDANGLEIMCNTDGVFSNLPGGTYCMNAHLDCPDTTLIRCITLRGPVPSVGGTVSLSNVTCNTFTATVTRWNNLDNPRFCLYDDQDNLIECNTRGEFSNLPFGNYCIKITTDCYDTTIVRCFSKQAIPVNINVNGDKSCNYGFAQLNITVSNAVMPVHVIIYAPDGTNVREFDTTRTSFTVDNLPGTNSGLSYKIVVEDPCGNRDSARSGATASYLNHNAVVNARCPGGAWVNGSGNILATATTNLGRISVRITKKNGVSYSSPLTPNFTSGNTSNFNDLGPGVYIVRYTENDCNRYVYDTVTINTYQYPNLDNSSAYQCDANGFSVSAIAANGVSPYQYEIIGSVPASPSISSAPQASTIFNINNGATYSLIRLRAIDACGNATLGDASILPLANNGIFATGNCFANPTTLTVDSIYNATFNWYLKEYATAPDSVYIGSNASVYVAMLTAADTGVYICHVNVNGGCIKRTYIYHIDGFCHVVLPVTMNELRGHTAEDKNWLNWQPQSEDNIDAYDIERKTSSGFESIGMVTRQGNSAHQFVDLQPVNGLNYYRLKAMKAGRVVRYSNTVALNNNRNSNWVMEVYPNPATDHFQVALHNATKTNISIRIVNMTGKPVYETAATIESNAVLRMQKPMGIPPGMYIIRCQDQFTGSWVQQKMIFR